MINQSESIQNLKHMDATELRIGNYIYTPDALDDEIPLWEWVQSIYMKDGIYYAGILPMFSSGLAYGEFKVSELIPIEITKQWLLDLGFKETIDGYLMKQYHLQNQCLYIQYFHGWICYQGFIGYKNEIINIKYIHELQNLYFALSGEELTKTR